MPVIVHAVGRPEVVPFRMPDRFRHEVTYFSTLSDEPGAAKLPPGEYRIALAEAKTLLDEGVLRIVSPLDSASKAEIELSEEQEAWLEWIVAGSVEHVRLV